MAQGKEMSCSFVFWLHPPPQPIPPAVYIFRKPSIAGQREKNLEKKECGDVLFCKLSVGSRSQFNDRDMTLGVFLIISVLCRQYI
jgi:hypothetical protein